MSKWDYMVLEWIWDQNSYTVYYSNGFKQAGAGSYAEITRQLAALGADGWEVAGNTASANWVFWTLKRAL